MPKNKCQHLDFLVELLREEPGAQDWKQHPAWRDFYETTTMLINDLVLPSDFPQKMELRAQVDAMLHKCSVLLCFPQLIGKKAICYAGCKPAERKQMVFLPPEFRAGTIKVPVVVTAPGRASDRIGAITLNGKYCALTPLNAVQKISDAGGNPRDFYSAFALHSGKVQQNIAIIDIPKESLEDGEFFYNLLMASDVLYTFQMRITLHS